MAYHVYLTEDPVIGPTHGQKCGNSSKLFFKSIGYAVGVAAPEFEIIFKSTDILTRYNKGQSDAPKGNAGVDARTWKSKKVGKYQQVVIKLKNSHPNDGYKYDVVMNGNTWDPRVVPR